jgi:membrane dipeptidase
MITRRQALAFAGALGVSKIWPSAFANALPDFPEEKYSGATVIDALGEPGDFDPDAPDHAPLSAKAVADAKSSGVTAVNVTVSEVGNGPNRFEMTVDAIAGIDHEIAAHPDVFLKVLRGGDLILAKQTARMGLIFGFQDTSMLEGDLARLAVFHDLGVRISQPTYNRRNLMGDGCLEVADGGLSRLGYDFIAELKRLRMLLDLSHAGARTISQAIAASTVPLAITHTGCRALNDVPRNTDDAALRALAEKGGVVGIYFMPFLRPSGQPHAEDVIRHLEHAVDVCGEDHVGLGTDGIISGIEINDGYRKYQRKFFEGRQKAGIAAPGESADIFNLIPEYNEPRRFKKLADDLSRRGWPSNRVEKILGANFARLFTEVWSM